MDPVHTLQSTINDDSPYILNMPPSTKSTKPFFGFQKETVFKPQKVVDQTFWGAKLDRTKKRLF